MKIFYEDQDLVIFEKEPGLDSEKIKYKDLFIDDGTLYCVHRLDKEVGGVTIYAKNEKMAAILSDMFSKRDISKTYLAVVEGTPEEKGVFEDLLFHDRRVNKTYVVKRERKGVKKASLSYELFGTKNGLSLVRVALHTGRTHQIRVQFASRKMPLAGDKRYGSNIKAKHVSLWSNSLSFVHPYTKEECRYESMPSSDYPWSLFK